MYEEVLRGGQTIPLLPSPNRSKWKKKCEELQQENQRILKQMQIFRYDTTSLLLNKTFKKLKGYLEEFWTIFQKNMDNTVSHNRINNKLGAKLHEKTLEGTNGKEIDKINRLLAKHDKFDIQLQTEFDECKDMVKY